ncbi:endonuclease/exonuclease/phosphatase [Pedobacter sp. G11]|uniref:endonuclease/exonuclease/phosphatase family protein n=1 Tax=Pedobacter sp. G11 TaxID=2482728 RepID=UPI000F5F6810|nr:endonuclease/exonuclease/phosphatase family protein [Pedobacter sp. G11]AZI24761.1 endonuclease/exonuclease/phosphatase [Pedobacter sp. G11]
MLLFINLGYKQLHMYRKAYRHFYFFLFALLVACSPKMAINKNNPNEIRVLSYNIHHANPPSKSKEGLIDIEAIAKVIASQSPDLVALQEVDVNTKRSGNINEAVVLATKLKMNFYFFKAIDHDGGDYGVAILSRYPLTDPQTYRLPSNQDPKAEPRILGMGTASLPDGRKIRFASTHLDAQRPEENRMMQVKEINRLTEKESLPLILAGDLNADPNSESIKIFDQQFVRSCENCGFTIPVINPRHTIDHISYKKGNNFKVISHQVINETYASDHLPVLAVLQLNR